MLLILMHAIPAKLTMYITQMKTFVNALFLIVNNVLQQFNALTVKLDIM